jgi:hypothetical protein
MHGGRAVHETVSAQIDTPLRLNLMIRNGDWDSRRLIDRSGAKY